MPAASRQRWFTFSAVSLIFFVVSAGAFSSLGVVLPAMVSELHWNWTQAGFGYTLLGLACGLASLMPAVLIRRIGVRGTMAVGTVAMAAGFAAMAMTHSVWLYLLGTLLIGLSFALVSTVPGTHVLTDLFKNRSTALGAYFTIGALGQVAGPLMYVGVHELTNGWRPYWLTFVVMALAAGLFAILTTPGKRDESHHAAAAPEIEGPGEVLQGLKDWTVRRALATSQFYVIVGGYTTFLLINTTAHGFAVAHLTERGVDPKAAAAMLSLEALIGAGVSVLGGVVGEKVSAKTLMIASLLALTIGTAGLAQASGWALMMVYALGVGLGLGLSLLASTMLLFQYFGKRPNLELFSIMCLISTSAAIGPAFGGWGRDTTGSFTGMFWLCVAIPAAMLAATLFMRPPALAPAPRVRTASEPAS
ncbi:MAG: transporter [Phenylobacterium sp.]|nr:transporter [Phenylobacterium sp.]